MQQETDNFEMQAYSGELGALYRKDSTIFRVWAPSAEAVTLNLYSKSGQKLSAFSMQRKENIWEQQQSGDLDGIFFTYTVQIDGKTQETTDIYAKACGVNGLRGQVLNLKRTNPEGWETSSPVHLEHPADAVIYELHVRDFSMDAGANFQHRGKFLAFMEEHVTNAAGEPVGLDYIASLGVTHIHLLPVMDFESLDESYPDAGFNWGYDPMHYHIPEGSYATNAADGAVRIRELKELILAAHRKGLGIVLDVVYNHTYTTERSSFSRLVPGYYYRMQNGQYTNGSGCGNEFASEKTMARKLITDSLCYLAAEYKLDGFRFDLMGLLDIETMNECARKLRKINPDILLYGEGWAGGLSPFPEELRAVKCNARQLSGIAMFSDDCRDGIKGSVFSDTACGYVNGNASFRDLMQSVLCGGVFHPEVNRPESFCWAGTPCQSVNYTEAHDDLTFHDKLTLSMPGHSESDLLRADRMGAALVILSQGIPFLQAGQEFFRSKPLPGGGFDHNSYRSPDSINSLKWNDLTKYRSLADYYKGLIAIRRKFPEFRMTRPEQVQQIHFQNLEDNAFCAEIGDFLLLVNPSERDISLLVSGTVYADGERASADGLYTGQAICKAGCILLIRGA